MKTFREYLSAFKRKYVCLNLDTESEKKFREYVKSLGYKLDSTYSGEKIDEEDFEFHVTVFYTENRLSIDNGVFNLDKPVQLVPKQFSLFGPDKNIHVLELKVTDALSDLRDVWAKQGMVDKWTDYNPHLSLTYNREGNPDQAKMKLPDFPIFADKIKIKDVDDSK